MTAMPKDYYPPTPQQYFLCCASPVSMWEWSLPALAVFALHGARTYYVNVTRNTNTQKRYSSLCVTQEGVTRQQHSSKVGYQVHLRTDKYINVRRILFRQSSANL